MATHWLVAALLLANLGGLVPPGRRRAAAARAGAEGAAPKVAVALISEVAGIEPGATLWVGLRQRIAPGWHTYWLNPGRFGRAAGHRLDPARGLARGADRVAAARARAGGAR